MRTVRQIRRRPVRAQKILLEHAHLGLAPIPEYVPEELHGQRQRTAAQRSLRVDRPGISGIGDILVARAIHSATSTLFKSALATAVDQIENISVPHGQYWLVGMPSQFVMPDGIAEASGGQ